ncbi:MAG: MFS transporter [Alphaproteobacteria bacterium]
MNPTLTKFLFLNLGHFLTHLFMLLYPTVVLALETEWQRPYSELIALSLPGFIAFAAGALPAGWLADRWSRKGVLAIFFIGIGAASILTGFARSPIEIAAGLALVGLFASIYHPVGIAMVVEGRDKVGKALGINGVWGNMGVALAAIVAGALTSVLGWRYAFFIPGAITVLIGLAFIPLVKVPRRERVVVKGPALDATGQRVPVGIFAVLIVATLGAGLIFNTTTVSLPKLFEAGLGMMDGSLLGVSGVVTAIIAAAAFVQIGTGVLIDRYPVRPIWMAIMLCQVPLLALAGLAAGAGLLVVAVPLAFLVLGEIPIQDALVARYAAESWRSRIYAAKFVLAIGTYAAVVPLIAIFHNATGNFVGLYALLAGIAVIVAIAAAFMPRRVRTHDTVAPQPAE